jgi:hypothetical protein
MLTSRSCRDQLSRLKGYTRRSKQKVLQPVSMSDQQDQPNFQIVSEKVIHQRYLTVYDTQVQFPPSNSASTAQTPPLSLHFDLVGHPQANFQYAVTFPFHPHPLHPSDWRKGQVTLLREYAQGVNQLVYCLPTGAYDPRKHSTLLDCAKAELSEEALLRSPHTNTSSWHCLLESNDSPGIIEVKWCKNRFLPFIVVDAELDPRPGNRDKEEVFMEVMRVSVEEAKRLARSGEMLLPSVATIYLAIDWLESRNL